jgi:hypothetical protein
VNHYLFPLKRVRTMRYRGTEEGARITVDSHVRDKRVEVNGVLTTAVDVEERRNGRLVERTTDYYAQDLAGNVWYLGERVDNIRRGKVVDHEGQWLAGRDGARRGLLLPVAPRVGTSMRQTRAPGVSEDRAKIVKLRARVVTSAGTFTGCTKTREHDLRGGEPPGSKYYCPKVGLVRERSREGMVDLVRFRRAR